jgi:curved DNA-binding protein
LEDLFGGGSPFSDFFGQIFGGMEGSGASPQGARRGGFEYEIPRQRGRDYEQELEISLREAYQGTTRILQKDGRRLEVQIPPGAREGTRVRMSKEGGPGTAGGEAGDLYLRIRVAPDPQFERRGDDLHLPVPVDLYTAVLGGEVPVPTLNDLVILTIPPGTQNGRQFRLRGKGMPHLQQPEQHGDLYARVDVRLPESLKPRQRELFEELRRISEEGAKR